MSRARFSPARRDIALLTIRSERDTLKIDISKAICPRFGTYLLPSAVRRARRLAHGNAVGKRCLFVVRRLPGIQAAARDVFYSQSGALA
jgi:hypothetical protein